MSMRLSSAAESVWRITRDALVRIHHILAETGNSDDDLVFHIRRAEGGMRTTDRDRARRSGEHDKVDS
jgi:hypothetical protein